MATRKQIREAAVAAISAIFARCEPYNLASVDERDFPLAMAYIEAGETTGDYDAGYESESLLIIECWDKDSQNIDSKLDLLANQVNAELEKDDSLGGLLDGFTRNGFSIERDPESFTGSIALTFIIHYEDED